MRVQLLAATTSSAAILVTALLGAIPVSGASPAPAASGQLVSADRLLTPDGRIRDADLRHDSRDDVYRSPAGAVAAGTSVVLRLRAAAGDLTAAELRLTDTTTGTASVLPMSVVATDPEGGEHGYDYWAATVDTPDTPAILGYSFVAHDGASQRYLSDDGALDGGPGFIDRVTPHPELAWQLTAYAPGFSTPAWAHGATVYQIFPDRFANGDPGNDPSPDESPGPTGGRRYRQPDIYGNPVLVKRWGQLPEGWCRDQHDVPCEEQPLGRDFFGGDLAGITAHLDDLVDRGITAVYLNPIFAAPSNHRYDTSDYLVVDPDLGTQADFDALVAGAHAHGIRVILDGVFNHVSSDSPWFDRYHRYPAVGACESADSPYRSWFTFRAPGPGEPSPCAPSTPGGTDTYYESWAGFDTIPALAETPEVVAMLTGPDGVVRHWLRAGIDGWRLDVAQDLSQELLRAIRDAAKAEDPDALVIVEDWENATPLLLGDQGDSTMDYRFRRAAIGLVNGATADPDGSIDALTPNGFVNQMRVMQEQYPPAAWDALLHMVDSHDTARLLWTLTPGQDGAAKEEATARAEGKRRQALVATLQLTFPGMADIFYGDDAGITGADDPDDRRPYPWGSEDLDVTATYRALGRLRAGSDALRRGDLTFLAADDAAGTLAYLRRSDTQAAIVALDLGARDMPIHLDVSGLVPDGTTFLTPLVAGSPPLTVQDGQVTLPVGAGHAAILLTQDGADLAPPTAPGAIRAEAHPGSVALDWAPVDSAAGYEVWRSLVTGGGYARVGMTATASFVDDSVRNGAPAYYVVTALDTVGNVSARSPEAMALPQVSIDTVGLVGGDPAPLPLAADGPGATVSVAVTLADGSAGDATSGLRVQVGSATAGTDPTTDRWVWVTARPDPAGTWVATLHPEEAGAHDLLVRASSDGGMTWITDGPAGHLTVLPATDTPAPPAPGAPALVDVADDHVGISWTAPTADDLYRYVVLRGPTGSTRLTPIGTTDKARFTDTTVTAGRTYDYAVVAQDTSFNSSAPSEVLSVEASRRIVQVTFQVSVPADTPPGGTVYIAGDFQGWAPGQTPMREIDPGTWSITLPFEDGTAIQYKYTRGTWDAVEKDQGCGEIPNRTLTVDFSVSTEQQVQDSVDKWRDVDGCG